MIEDLFIKETLMQNQQFTKGQQVFDLVKEVIDVTGPRLPGSEEERKGAEIIANQIERELGTPTITEQFKTPRHACISAIPWLGWGMFIAFCLFYLSPIASLVVSTALLLFALTHIFYYSHMLDKLFKKDISQNVYSTLEPRSGNKKYTVMLTAHMDSSWCWMHSYKNPKTMMIKTGIGVISGVALLVVSVITIILEAVSSGKVSFMGLSSVFANLSTGVATKTDIAVLVMYCLPVLFLPGFYWLSTYLSYDKAKAAPGAMDNLSGVATAIAVAKHFKDNPDDCGDARIIVMGAGAEESGLVGALAFVKKHKDDKNIFDEHTYVLNLDSFRDYDNFNVVKKDTLQFKSFDKELVELSQKAIANCGLEVHTIENPVGGSDSTAFAKAGIKTVTLNAQDPRPTDYYHTTRDTLDNLNLNTLDKGFEVVREVVRLIDAKYRENN